MSQQQQREGHAGGLLGLPVEVRSFLFGRLDAASLARLSTTCPQMRRRVDRVSGLRLLEKVARNNKLVGSSSGHAVTHTQHLIITHYRKGGRRC